MEINITPIPIERGKNEATKIQIALKDDNLEDSATVQCAYYDADNNLLKIVHLGTKKLYCLLLINSTLLF